MALVMLGVMVGLPMVAGDANGVGEFAINEVDVDSPMQPFIVSKVAVVRVGLVS